MNSMLTAVIVLAAALFQAPARPPFKIGLWESVGSMSVTGQDGKPLAHVVRSCFTEDNWQRLLGPTGENACPKVKEVWSNASYSFDVKCEGKPKTASVSVAFDGPESRHGTLEIFSPTGIVTMHASFQDHWVSSECGDVSPDSPVVVSGQRSSGSH